MITQQQENELQQKAQAPSPVKEHRWRVALFSILGVALPLVAGSMLWWPWWSFPFYTSQWVGITMLLVWVVSVTVGAFLLYFTFRTWRVAVFAGVAWIVGEFLGAMVILVSGVWQMAPEWLWVGQVMLILLALVPLLICIAIGSAIASRWMD